MNDFLKFVLEHLRTGILLAVPMLVMSAGALWGYYTHFRKKHGREKPFPWLQVFLYILLAGYLVVLLYATLLRFSGGWLHYNIHPFLAWQQAWNDFSFKSWANIFLNVALFLPVGILFPALWKCFRNWKVTLSAGCGLSLLIELLQLVFKCGVCDVDDLIANSLGVILGFLLVSVLLDRKRWPRYAILSATLILLLVLPFGIYGAKTYGNLPDHYTYRLNTAQTQWNLACTLPPSPDTAPVYQGNTLSKKECKIFIESFGALVEAKDYSISYYQDMVYCNFLGGGILEVFYRDGSWEYFNSLLEGAWAQWEQPEIEKLLADYPIEIPTEAEFTAEADGWHSFSCDMQRSGTALLDGEIRCRIAADGTLQTLEDKLNRFTYHSDAEILSPAEAWEKLQQGFFLDIFGYTRTTPAEIFATDCCLAYTVDTKGFYQPIWQFTLSGTDGFSGIVEIPAVRGWF